MIDQAKLDHGLLGPMEPESVSVPDTGTTVVAKYVGPHPCPLPGRRERKRRGIQLGDIIECEGCHQRWEWKDIGWGDSQKVWWKSPSDLQG